VVLGSNFLELVSPFTIDKQVETFSCCLKGFKLTCPLSFKGTSKCRKKEVHIQPQQNLKDLFKVECVALFANSHGAKAIADLKEKFEATCCLEHPNVYWTREKYFVGLEFRENMAEVPQKASTSLMSPSEKEFCQKEITKLLEKGLIEPSKSARACKAFVVNKHSEQK